MKANLHNKRAGLTVLFAFLVVIAPMSLLVNYIDLLAPVSDLTGSVFTLLTNSAGSKGFVITLIVLSLVCLRLHLPRRTLVKRAIQLVIILLVGFASKTGLKLMTESPRPYTELLAHQLLIPQADHFYKLNIEQQHQIITNISKRVSHWRTDHWQGETDYSFPSGHTMFVAICLVMFGGLFMEQKRYGLLLLLGAWATGVAYSRLWLGMHHPIDLVGSVIFIAAVYTLLPAMNTLGYRVTSYIDYWLTPLHR
ncbi:phosphatase PAP2 family protein [Vibrio sinensis]|uniref:undecaprenyl-diphosphate phosphatase n=1 Tax=Vibrio sinensis TaxID=2302434 RepID=A0A3A6Q6J3_9VIBR|nr:phosphatase PAP2 family protein [Vibrio sinensis]RJX66228.1 phosphatase PAP2 family protein [Vibrio sinensis]